MRHVAFLLVLAALAGCLEGSEAPSTGEDPEDLSATVRAHIRAYLERDVERALSFDADPWVDLGGGGCMEGAAAGSATTTTPPATNGSAATISRMQAEPEPMPRDDPCDPANVTHAGSRARLTDAFASEDYRRATEGRSPEDLFDLANLTQRDARDELATWNYRGPFVAQDGDLAVHMPPLPGSYWFDGWFGVYRQVDGRWLRVAAD